MTVVTTGWYLKMQDNVAPIMERVSRTFGNAYNSFQKVQQSLDKSNQTTKVFASNVDSLNKKLNDLTRTRDLSINISDVTRLNREIEHTSKLINKIQTAGTGGGHWGKLQDGLNQIPGFGALRMLSGNPYAIAGTAVATGGSFAYKAARTRMDYDAAFAKVNTTAQLDDKGIGYLRGDVMQMGRNSAIPLNTVPAAYEKIISATGNAKKSVDILRQSLKGAEAGFADVNDVASATVGIMNTVGGNTKAKEVLDVLFAAKRLGVGEFKDFAQYLPSSITQGQGLGYDYKQTAGAFSYLTTKGFKADYAQTYLSNMFTSLGKDDVLKELKKKGINAFNKDGSRRDLALLLSDIGAKANKLSDESKTRMFGDFVSDAQAKTAFMALTKDTEGLGTMMKQVAKSAGEMDKALAKSANGLNDLQRLDNNWEAFKDYLGQAVAPAFISVLERLNRGFDESFKHQSRTDLINDPNRRKESLQLLEKEYVQGKRAGTMLGVDGQVNGREASLVLYYRNMMGLNDEQIKRKTGFLDAVANIDLMKLPAGSKRQAAWMLQQRMNPEDSPFKKGNASITHGIKLLNEDLTKVQDNISGGGNIKNFTVSIAQLKTADNLHIHAQDVPEAMEKIEDNIFDGLTRAVRSLEESAGGAN